MKKILAVIIALTMILSTGVLASGENESGFVYEPYWDESNIKTARGGEILFFGDIHDYEDDYFYYDAETGESNGVMSYLINGDKHPGLYVCIGDYLQSTKEITLGNNAFTKCTERIYAWEGEEVPILSVMGNHEYETAAADGLTGEQVFERYVGNNNYGLAAIGVDEEEEDKVLYYVVNFGTAHTQEIDAENTRANAKNKYWVNPDQIKALDETLAGIYGEDGTENQGIPTFINAHLPIHYYTSERCAENNCELLDVLNKYPYVVYVWGHNHSEKDPYYGTVKLPGNTIVPNAGLDECNAEGESAAQEIRFTYVSCGVVRGNQISDNTQEDSERALYVTLEDGNLYFEYCGRDGEVFDRTAYTELVDTTYFEEFTTLGAASAAGKTVNIEEETDSSVVRRGDFFLTRPVAGNETEEVVSFSDRYETTSRWLDPDGNETEKFENGISYTLELSLEGKDVSFALSGEDLYLFDTSAVVIPGSYIESKEVNIAEDGMSAVCEIVFAPTAALSETGREAVRTIETEKEYVLASASEQYLSSCGRVDCVTDGDTLLSEPDTEHTWHFEDNDGALVMIGSDGRYLTASVNGPHVVLTPVKDLSDASYSGWTMKDGALWITVSGKDYCFGCSNGEFALTTSSDNACRLYPAEK